MSSKRSLSPIGLSPTSPLSSSLIAALISSLNSGEMPPPRSSKSCATSPPSNSPLSFNAEAAFEAYQDAVGDLTTLMRARIGEYELKLSHAALCADEIITRARLLYFQGNAS